MLSSNKFWTKILPCALTAFTTFGLTGCGGGGGDSSPSSSTSTTPRCTNTQFLDDSSKTCKEKESQTIARIMLNQMQIGETVTLQDKSSIGLPVTFTSVTQDVCSVQNNNQIFALKAGECSIIASQSGNQQTLPAAIQSRSFLVRPVCNSATEGLDYSQNACIAKIAQTIQNFSLNPAWFAGYKRGLGGRATSGLELQYTSLTPDICEILPNGILMGLKAGICTVRADQAGNDKYLPAPSVETNGEFRATQKTVTLTKTGTQRCANATKNNLTCTQESLGEFFGLKQDGEVQAGATLSYELLTQNNQNCIKDVSTGLIWEDKTKDGGIRDGRHIYTWYDTNTETNGGDVGGKDLHDLWSRYPTGKTCANSLTQCNTQDFLKALNSSRYCGYTDWRLPTKQELESIIDFGRTPTIHPFFVNNTSYSDEIWERVGSEVWSSSTVSLSNNAANGAWIVTFQNGYSTLSSKQRAYYVRAVRGE